ncbi:hypothetical protein FACS189499_09430 [Clostridia bacterium]|nr:hypothetical protein FACS189499_09430 [Clostridia bacterium]
MRVTAFLETGNLAASADDFEKYFSLYEQRHKGHKGQLSNVQKAELTSAICIIPESASGKI